jgi:hypothetical protein
MFRNKKSFNASQHKNPPAGYTGHSWLLKLGFVATLEVSNFAKHSKRNTNQKKKSRTF